MLTESLPIISLQIVNLHSSSLIAIADTSTYITVPSSSGVSMQITPPGYPTVNVTFTPGTVNIYKCVDLGITCTDADCTALPDGIYVLNYGVLAAPNPNYQKQPLLVSDFAMKFIKVDQINCKFQNIFLKMDTLCNCHNQEQKELKKTLRQVKLLIDGAVAACNNQEDVLSYDLYTKAIFVMNNMGCNFKGNMSNWGCGC